MINMKKIMAILVAFIAPGVYAEDDYPDIFSLSLEELLKIKITGSTLTQEDRLSVPAAVTVFTRKELSVIGLDYLDELANLVPGFQSYRVAGSAAQNPMSSRGRRISVVAAEILIMVDGIRFDGPRSSGSAIVIPKYSIDQIERVEFIRGPGAAIYGSNAMMGIINIVTRTDVNEVHFGYGSFNRQQVSFGYSKKFAALKLDLYSQIDRDSGQNYLIGASSSASPIETKDPRTTGSLNLKLQWSQTRVNLIHRQFAVQDFYELDGISNGFNHRNGRFDALSFQYDFNWHDFDSSVQFDYKETNVNLASQLTAVNALSAISTPSSSDALFAEADFDDYVETRLVWQNSLQTNLNRNIQFGAEIRHIDAPQADTLNNFDLGDLANGRFPIRYYGDLQSTTPVQGKSQRDIFGLYAQYQREILTRTQLTLGVRYDDFSHIGSQFSPRIGIVYSVNSKHSLKFLYGEAFRAPSESELNLINNPVLLGNPTLKPETVKSTDIIWVGQWSRAAIALDYFENHFSNAITQTLSEFGIPRYENLDQAPTKGFEFELSGQITDNWLISTNYTNITTKPEISYREASQLSSLASHYKQNGWDANLIVTWHSQRELAALEQNGSHIRLPENYLINASFGHDIDSHWRSALQIKNLQNKNFYTPTLSTGLTRGVINRGREILFNISYRF